MPFSRTRNAVRRTSCKYVAGDQGKKTSTFMLTMNSHHRVMMSIRAATPACTRVAHPFRDLVPEADARERGLGRALRVRMAASAAITRDEFLATLSHEGPGPAASPELARSAYHQARLSPHFPTLAGASL